MLDLYQLQCFIHLYQSIFLQIIRYSLLNKIITVMVDDWKEREVSDNYTMTRIAYISRRFSNFIIVSHAVSVFLYATGTLLRHRNDNQTDTRELILKMELPFAIESTSVYVAVLVTQFVHQTSAASMAGVMNSLLITLVSASLVKTSMFLKIIEKYKCNIM